MINKRQEKMLRQGTEVWNAWRKRYADEQPDLQGADLRGVDLQGAHLADVDLRGAILAGANLSGADLWEAHLNEADLQGAKLVHADLRGVDFAHADLREANLSQAWLGGVTLTQADLRHANLCDIDAGDGTDFCQANLSHATLSNAIFDHVDFSEAILDHAILSGAHFVEANFGKASLQHALLRHTDLSGALLDDTDVSDAVLFAANFSHAHFKQTNFSRSTVGWNLFNDVDLCSIDGLETVKHIGPSEISVSTLYRSAIALPETFLRLAGVPSSFLQHLSYPLSHKLAHMRCFIYYTSSHEEFAQQLSGDLLALNMCCWSTPLDSQLDFWSFMDNPTSLYDRLIFILAKEEEESERLKEEEESERLLAAYIKMAIQKEQQDQQRCFSLVSVDNDAIKKDLLQMLAEHDHAARSIISFSPWQSSDTYTHALQALLRDLAWTSEVQDC